MREHVAAITKTVQALAIDGVRRATTYVSPMVTVKATRQRRPNKRDRSETVILTIGRPNYREREFITICRKAGEPFPVRKVQLQYFPKRKRA